VIIKSEYHETVGQGWICAAHYHPPVSATPVLTVDPAPHAPPPQFAVARYPGDELQASPDFFTSDGADTATDFGELDVIKNDDGPSRFKPDYNGTNAGAAKAYLTIESFTQPARGVVELVQTEWEPDSDSPDAATRYFTYTPNEDFECGIDHFFYSISDPAWPRRGTTMVTLVILPADFDAEREEKSFEEVPRDKPFFMTRLTVGDLTCGGTISSVSKLDEGLGRLNRNKGSVSDHCWR